MNKHSYDAAIYLAFFDELEKLGFDVSGMDKEAIIGAGILRAGKAGIGKAVGALTPSSMKASRALRNPGMTSVGSGSSLINAGKARQLAPPPAALSSTGSQIARAGRSQQLQQARTQMSRPVGGSSW